MERAIKASVILGLLKEQGIYGDCVGHIWKVEGVLEDNAGRSLRDLRIGKELRGEWGLVFSDWVRDNGYADLVIEWDIEEREYGYGIYVDRFISEHRGYSRWRVSLIEYVVSVVEGRFEEYVGCCRVRVLGVFMSFTEWIISNKLIEGYDWGERLRYLKACSFLMSKRCGD